MDSDRETNELNRKAGVYYYLIADQLNKKSKRIYPRPIAQTKAAYLPPTRSKASPAWL